MSLTGVHPDPHPQRLEMRAAALGQRAMRPDYLSRIESHRPGDERVVIAIELAGTSSIG
jgi:hypothetical protein